MIFLDTCYFKALIDKRDPYHKTALKIKKYLSDENKETMVNTTVVVETLNKSFKIKFPIDELFNNLHEDNKVVELTHQDYLKSLEISGWFDNSINYSDCTIVETMLEENVSNIVTFDSDFKKIKFFNVIYDI